MKDSHGHTSFGTIHASYSLVKGTVRKEMEDRIAMDSWNHKSTTYYCFVLMDGHSGSECVDYVTAHIIPLLKVFLTQNESIRKALKETFAALVEKTSEMQSGTTVSVLLIIEKRDEKRYYVAHLGDSTVVGIRMDKGAPILERITMDHKPRLKSEQKLLNAQTGYHDIKEGYLYVKSGEGLAMTRSLGDAAFNGTVIREPTIHQLQVKYNVIILASDGLYDVVKTRELLKILSQDDKPLETSAKRLNDWRNTHFVQHDNTSVIIVFI